MEKIPDTALTHGGKFHADDVFSAALLRQMNPNLKIIRAFEVPDGFEGIVFDIGRGRFDHHQENAEVRENGVPYAAFGLLWREYGKGLLGALCVGNEAEEEAERFDGSFIQPLDLTDNTGCENQLADAIGAFNPNWDSDDAPDRCFEEAAGFAAAILRRKLLGIVSACRAADLVEQALASAEEGVVHLPRFAPWKKVLIPSDAEFVVYPSQRGGYSAQGVPAGFDTQELKCPFPQDWAGKPAEELQRLTGIGTLTFCHKGRFLISADRREDAEKACLVARRERPDRESGRKKDTSPE